MYLQFEILAANDRIQFDNSFPVASATFSVARSTSDMPHSRDQLHYRLISHFDSAGKLISFLRMFFLNRPSRTTLKTKGIVKERLFGCDLGEHLLNSGQEGKRDNPAFVVLTRE